MKFSMFFRAAVFSLLSVAGYAQCIQGGCEVGLSRYNDDDGIFIGHYEGGQRQGLGIVYSGDTQKYTASYSNYFLGKKDGVEYSIAQETPSQNITHTFTNYNKGVKLFPAFRIHKNDSKTAIEVAFSEESGWEKYKTGISSGEMLVDNIVYDGSPAFVLVNGKNVLMSLAVTIGKIELFSSAPQDVYFNPLQMIFEDKAIEISVFPRNGADETVFRADANWQPNNHDEGVWVYKRYFNDALSYKMRYEDVLELPTMQQVKQQKLEKAFVYVAEQVDSYNFEKGHPAKAKDFIDTLNEIKDRAQRLGLDISSTFDITMTKLYLQQKNENMTLKYAQNACDKSAGSFDIIKEIVTVKYPEYSEIMTKIKRYGSDDLNTAVTSKS